MNYQLMCDPISVFNNAQLLVVLFTLLMMMMMKLSVHSTSLQSCSSLIYKAAVVSHPLLHNLAPPSLPAGASGARPLVFLSRGLANAHGSLGGTGSVSLAPPPPAQARPVPGCRCFSSLHLIVSVSGRESSNMMESDFWTAGRLLPFVPHEWDWKLGNRRGVQMSVCKA